MCDSSSSIRRAMWLLAVPVAGSLILSGCQGGQPDPKSSDGSDAGRFSLMMPQANDEDDFWAQLATKYADETGADIELIPYPSDSYITQVTTQLQSGNAADAMILTPGTGQPTSVVSLAKSGLLEPLSDASAAVIPKGTAALYEVDGEVYGQPAALLPVGLVFNAAAASEANIDEFPESFDSLLDACVDARNAGKSFMAVAGSVPPNNGLLAQVISADRVYAETPDWNEQRAAGDVTFAESDWQLVLQDIIEMNEAGCFQDGVAGGNFDSITSALGSGSSFSAALPGSAVPSISAATGIELTVQAFPPANDQTPHLLTSANNAWAINASAEQFAKDSAQAFLEWVAMPAQAAEFAQISGAIPITGVVAEDLPAAYQPVGMLLEGGNYAPLPNATWPNPAVYDELSRGVQGLLTGQTTVDQVLESMDTAWG